MLYLHVLELYRIITIIACFTFNIRGSAIIVVVASVVF